MTFLSVLLPSGRSSPGLARVLGKATGCHLRSLFSEAGGGAAAVQSSEAVGRVLAALPSLPQCITSGIPTSDRRRHTVEQHELPFRYRSRHWALQV